MRRYAALLAVALALGSCQPPETDNDAMNNAAPSDEQSTNNAAEEAAGSDPPKIEPGVSATGGTKALAGSLAQGEIMLPAALNRGVFSRKGNCLQVAVSGLSYTPVLGGEATFTPDGFAIGSKKFLFGRTYTLAGGPVQLADAGIIVPDEVRRSCPQQYYAVAQISAP